MSPVSPKTDLRWPQTKKQIKKSKQTEHIWKKEIAFINFPNFLFFKLD